MRQQIESSSNSKFLICRELVVLHITICSVSLWCKLEVVWRFERRTFFIDSMRVNLIWACQEVLKRVLPSMDQNRLLFIQVQALPPRMHKWKEIIDLQTRLNEKPYRDQLLMRSPIDLKV